MESKGKVISTIQQLFLINIKADINALQFKAENVEDAYIKPFNKVKCWKDYEQRLFKTENNENTILWSFNTQKWENWAKLHLIIVLHTHTRTNYWLHLIPTAFLKHYQKKKYTQYMKISTCEHNTLITVTKAVYIYIYTHICFTPSPNSTPTSQTSPEIKN